MAVRQKTARMRQEGRNSVLEAEYEKKERVYEPLRKNDVREAKKIKQRACNKWKERSGKWTYAPLAAPRDGTGVSGARTRTCSGGRESPTCGVAHG